MTKAAVLILAGTDGNENLGRIVLGLETPREFAEHEADDLELIFDGAVTQLIPELEDPDSGLHELYQAVRDEAVGP